MKDVVERIRARCAARNHTSASTETYAYALIDAGANPSNFLDLVGYGAECECLLAGEQPQAMKRVAPYLVRLDADRSATDWILSEVLPRGEGIALISSYDLEDLACHSREFHTVRCREKVYYFKYFLPKVLSLYFPVLTEEQRSLFFSRIDAVIAAQGGGRFLVLTEEGTAEEMIKERRGIAA